jgi:hypothetical protein
MDQAHAGTAARRDPLTRGSMILVLAVALAIVLALSVAVRLEGRRPAAAGGAESHALVDGQLVGDRPMIRPAGAHTVKVDPRSASHGGTRHRSKWG